MTATSKHSGARGLTRATTRPVAATGGGQITKTVLPGGLRIITEAMPGVRSASVGVWVPVGSRDETPAVAGASHFLEHLLFKGTARRSALDIASAMDAVGGEFNAFTEKEHTCFYATVLDRDLPLAIDIVTDVVLNATRHGRRTSTSNVASCSKRSRCATTIRPTSCTTSSRARCSATCRSGGPSSAPSTRSRTSRGARLPATTGGATGQTAWWCLLPETSTTPTIVKRVRTAFAGRLDGRSDASSATRRPRSHRPADRADQDRRRRHRAGQRRARHARASRAMTSGDGHWACCLPRSAGA